MKNQKGFSLVELLVVVIIIAIIAAIAIPNLLASRRAANEASAVNNLRTIHSAQVTYFATEGNNSTYGDFGGLTGENLIDPSWADSVVKSTYTYTLTVNASDYCALATSSDTDADDYGVSEAGTVFFGANGAGGCAGGALTGLTTVVGTTAPVTP